MNYVSVNTQSGTCRGTSNDGVRLFRGITYARYERFAPSHLCDFPEGEYDATDYGRLCPQLPSKLAALLGDNIAALMEEGRLDLTITAPIDAAPDSNLPVMVWIHGGSYLTGGSEDHRYSCARLVKTGNVIVVKISYRLGAPGYLYMPSEGCVNLGLGDQINALRWIRKNIAFFGGDPSNVTIFSQSAGAHAVASIIAVSTDEVLFRRAILQSPPLGVTISEFIAKRLTNTFLIRLGMNKNVAPMSRILEVQDSMLKKHSGMPFMPVLEDNMAIPDAVKKAGVEIFAGYADDDASPYAKPVLGPLFGTKAGKPVVNLFTRKIFGDSTEAYVKAFKAAGLKASVYHFGWHPEGNPYGACHCIELPFLLGEYEDWTEAKMLQGMTREEFEANSAAVLSTWTTFAKTGEVLQDRF